MTISSIASSNYIKPVIAGLGAVAARPFFNHMVTMLSLEALKITGNPLIIGVHAAVTFAVVLCIYKLAREILIFRGTGWTQETISDWINSREDIAYCVAAVFFVPTADVFARVVALPIAWPLPGGFLSSGLGIVVYGIIHLATQKFRISPSDSCNPKEQKLGTAYEMDFLSEECAIAFYLQLKQIKNVNINDFQLKGSLITVQNMSKYYKDAAIMEFFSSKKRFILTNT